jgi:hypothetical protein
MAQSVSLVKLKQLEHTFVLAFNSTSARAKAPNSSVGRLKRKKANLVAARWPMPGREAK